MFCMEIALRDRPKIINGCNLFEKSGKMIAGAPHLVLSKVSGLVADVHPTALLGAKQMALKQLIENN